MLPPKMAFSSSSSSSSSSSFSSSSSSSVHLLILFFFFFFFLFLQHQSLMVYSFSPPPYGVDNYRLLKSNKTKFLFLPLKTQQVPSVSLPLRPPFTVEAGNMLYFQHNVSLTVTLTVGTPPQNVTMVLDTGSELSWLVCSSSPTATITSSTFHPKSSSSFHPITCSSPACTTQARDLPSPPYCDPSSKGLCHVSLSYADASTSEGDLSVDVLHIGQSPPLNAIFGCMTSTYSSTPTSDLKTTGLLGMNRGALSLISQMGTRRFSYCISDRDSSGVLLLGDAVLPFSLPLNYTPLIQISVPLPYFDRVAYSVELQGIRVAKMILPIPKFVLEPDHTGAGQTMVDSGTQFTFLLGPAYTVLKKEFHDQTKGFLQVYDDDPNFVYQGAFDLCYKVPPTNYSPPVEMLPAVTLMFRGAEMTVTGQRLLHRAEGVKAKNGDGIWCFTFGNSDLVPLEAYVIGHHHQQNVWVEYDLDNKRVGFAPVQCDVASQRLTAGL